MCGIAPKIAAALLSMAGACVSTSLAQDNVAEAEPWLLGLVNIRDRIDAWGDVQVRWRSRDRYVPSRDELELIRERIKDRPDHPNRALLRQYERRVAGKDFRDLHLAILSPDSCRFSDTRDAEPSNYFDCVLTPTARWSMSAASLSVLNPAVEPPSARDYRVAVHAGKDQIASLASGGLSSLRGKTIRVESWRNEGDRWEAKFTAEKDGRVFRGRGAGRWSSEASDRTVNELTLDITFSGQTARVECAAKDWKPHAAAGMMMAGTYSETTSGRIPASIEIVLNEVEPLSTEAFADLARIPTIAGRDPIRGQVTFTNFDDYRGMEAQFHSVDQDGNVTTVPQSQHPSVIVLGRYRLMGWVVLSCLVAGLVLLRIRAGHRV